MLVTGIESWIDLPKTLGTVQCSLLNWHFYPYIQAVYMFYQNRQESFLQIIQELFIRSCTIPKYQYNSFLCLIVRNSAPKIWERRLVFFIQLCTFQKLFILYIYFNGIDKATSVYRSRDSSHGFIFYQFLLTPYTTKFGIIDWLKTNS